MALGAAFAVYWRDGLPHFLAILQSDLTLFGVDGVGFSSDLAGGIFSTSGFGASGLPVAIFSGAFAVESVSFSATFRFFGCAFTGGFFLTTTGTGVASTGVGAGFFFPLPKTRSQKPGGFGFGTGVATGTGVAFAMARRW